MTDYHGRNTAIQTIQQIWLIQTQSDQTDDHPHNVGYFKKITHEVRERGKTFVAFLKKFGKVRGFVYLSLFLCLMVGVSFTPHVSRAFLAASSTHTDTEALQEVQKGGNNLQRGKMLRAALSRDPHPSVGGGGVSVVDDSALLATGGVSDPTIITDSSPAGKDKHWSGQVSVYVVRQGDNLSQIAELFGVSVNTIRWANDIKSDEYIHEGETLVILPITGIEHTVKKGETVKGIAKKYHADTQEILNYNSLPEDASLEIGSKIVIPDGEIGVSVTPNTQAPKKTPSVTHKSQTPTPSNTTTQSAGNGYFMEPLKHYTKTQGIHGHNGVDLAAPVGTPIYAAASGQVIVARNNGGWNGGYGNFVVINHPNGEQTLYAHMKEDIVRVGQHVVQGQVIGYVGVTGRTTGPHVHVEVHGGVNPL